MDICQISGLITECDEQLNGEGHRFHYILSVMNVTKVIQMDVPPRPRPQRLDMLGLKG